MAVMRSCEAKKNMKRMLAFVLAGSMLFGHTSCQDDVVLDAKTLGKTILFSTSTHQVVSELRSQHDSPMVDDQLFVLQAQEPGAKGLLLVAHEENRGGESLLRGATYDSQSRFIFALQGWWYDESKTFDQTTASDRTAIWDHTQQYNLADFGGDHIDTTTPWQPVKKAAFVAWTPTIATVQSASRLTMDYLVSDDPEKQTDLMVAYTPNQSALSVDGRGEPRVPLTFKHTLAAVKFEMGNDERGVGLLPGRVERIVVRNVKMQGAYQVQSADWLLKSDTKSVTIENSESEGQVAPPSNPASPQPLMDARNTLLMLPQDLADVEVEVYLRVDLDLADANRLMVFKSKLSGEWAAGKRYTYRITTPNLTLSPSLIVESNAYHGNLPMVAGANAYVGGTTQTFKVRSGLQVYGAPAGSLVAGLPVDIIGVYEMDGRPAKDLKVSLRPYDSYSWPGKTQHELKLDVAVVPTEHQAVEDYDLSKADGKTGSINTANTYIINAPGTYKFPLVYGNAIKNGADNRASYKVAGLMNHLGNIIDKPYIVDNFGCEPNAAYVLWSNLDIDIVRDIKLSDDKRYVMFTIAPPYFAYGNFVIAVKDIYGNIMWSWQLWLSDYSPQKENNISRCMPYPLGYRPPVNAANRKVRVVLGNKVPDELKPFAIDQHNGSAKLIAEQTLVVDLSALNRRREAPYYQWGRKDPFCVGYFTVGGRQRITAAQSIKSPHIIHVNMSPNTWWESGYHQKSFWNRSKTIYDPSPVGYRVLDGASNPGPSLFGRSAFRQGYINGSTIDYPEYGYVWSLQWKYAVPSETPHEFEFGENGSASLKRSSTFYGVTVACEKE